MNEIIKQLQAHRSIRKFTEQAVHQSIIEELIEAGKSAATSSFIQACTVIQVNDLDTRERMVRYSGEQQYVRQAPVFLVFCADMQRHNLVCSMHGATMTSGFAEQFLTASLDCALFAQNMVIGAESLGLGTCYIGGIRNEIAKVSEILELPDLVYPVFGLCLGYPAQDPEVKPRLPASILLKQDIYDDSNDVETILDYDKQVKEYYLQRTGGRLDKTWSGQIADMLVKESRPHMLDFLQSKGFLLK